MQRLIPIYTFLLFVAPAIGVGTSHWTHTTEVDFKKGVFHNVVATNLGDLKLSRAVKTLLEQDPKVSCVYALVESKDGVIYAGTGPEGVLLKLKDDKVETLLTLPDGVSIFSLLIDRDGKLLLGTGGDKGRILRIENEGEEPKEVFSADAVQYIWAMVQTPDGSIYAATGPEGQLFHIKPDGTNEVLFDSNENNVLSLITDGEDLLYAGTDPNGLVYRINRKNKEVFVLYDAAETEVATLALDGKGNLYAGTAEASEQPPAALPVTGAAEQQGRPEGGTTGVPIPAKPPENPEPPKPPDPNPGEPEPIPKVDASAKSRVFLMLADAPMAEGDAEPEEGDDIEPEPGIDIAQATTMPAAGGGAPVIGDVAVEPRPEGNGIYKIDKDGFVTEIFRQNVLVLSMIEKDGTLLVGTGSEGLIYQVNPAAEETIVLAKVEPKQVTSMLAASDGRVILGMANVGSLAAMSSGYAREGTYTSPVLDASQVSRFGKLQLHGTLPKGTSLKVATRSGNTKEPGETGWSDWSASDSATQFVEILSPPARYVQYRLTFQSDDSGTNSPAVEDVDVAYQVPNLAPQVTAIRITDAVGAVSEGAGAAAASPARTRTITWEASDSNSDTLKYTLHFRAGSSGPWIELKDKLDAATFEWDTRSVADGRYEIRVTASDASANAPGTAKTGTRVSDPVLVDNTAPVIGDLKSNVRGPEITIELKAVDRTSTIASVDYALDSSSEWQAVLASDNIFDSPQEAVKFTVTALPSGPHQVTVRATDSRGNQAFENILFTIEPPHAAGK